MPTHSTATQTRTRSIAWAAALAVSIAAGCEPEIAPGGGGCPSTGTTGQGGAGGAGGNGPGKTVLDERVLSYGEALRTASLKLRGNIPTLQEMEDLRTAADPKAKYEALIDAWLADPRFASRLIEYWRSTFRMEGPGQDPKPSLDTAPTFAARLVFMGQPFAWLFTQAQGTCPTFDGARFIEGSCLNVAAAAGVLTDPGIQAQYRGNLAMRRARFLQETFACKRDPAERAPAPYEPPPISGCEMASPYTAPWDFTKIAGQANGGNVDFQDCQGILCANCHATLNHRAPLFANFDDNGQDQGTIQVHLPQSGNPLASPTDWLVAGEGTAWKFGMLANDLMDLGQLMATDDEVIRCAIGRVWNYAMSKGDAVLDSAGVPPDSVIGPIVKDFEKNGTSLLAVWRQVFVHEDFVRF